MKAEIVQRSLAAIAAALVCASCTTNTTLPGAEAPARRSFAISSETSRFVIGGRLEGTLEVRDTAVVVVVDRGRVLSAFQRESKLALRAIIAGPDAPGRDARRVVESRQQDIGDFEKGVERSISAPITFTLPKPADFDAKTQWLVFEFRTFERRSTFVCDVDNLSGPDASGPRRATGWICWGNPAK